MRGRGQQCEGGFWNPCVSFWWVGMMIYTGNILVNNSIVTDSDISTSAVTEVEENHSKHEKPSAQISFLFFNKTVYLHLKVLLTCHRLQGNLKKNQQKTNIWGSVHSTAIRQAFFYAVCCTKLFKKPSALCKEITFLRGEDIKTGWGGGGGPMVQSNGFESWLVNTFSYSKNFLIMF